MHPPVFMLATAMWNTFHGWLIGRSFWQSYRRCVLFIFLICFLLSPLLAKLKGDSHLPLLAAAGISVFVALLTAFRLANEFKDERKRNR
jgi:glucose dehydrogenase